MNEDVLTRREDCVLVIEINRPAAKNALNKSAAEGIYAACAELDGDTTLGAGVLTGAGGVLLVRDGPEGLRRQGRPR